MRFKKFLCYLLCGVLTFGVICTANYKSAHAMEWVSGALSFAEALTWVLASLGITCTVSDYATQTDKSRQEFWESYEQDFYDYVDLHQGNTASDRFIEWKNKLCKGVLDKSSEYWSLFKEWASYTLTSNNNIPSVGAYKGIDNIITSEFPSIQSITGLSNINDIEFDIAILQYNGSDYSVVFLKGYYIGTLYNNGYYLYPNNNSSYFVQAHSLFSNNATSIQLDRYYGYQKQITGTSGSKVFGLSRIPNEWSKWNLDNLLSEKAFDSVTSNVDDLDVISSDGVDEDSPEVTLPYPGVSDSDDTISSDAYQDIIDAINDGTITQEDGVIEIQKILKIITYDTVTDDVVPPIKDDDGNNKKKDDVLKENKENAGFSLGGLEAVFPFCIPFDIYAFMTLLVADPVAPEFDFPIQSVNGQEEEIHIDLSPFEPVAVVVRYCFDFLFIIGLGLITRQLIGAGGGD